MTGRLITFEGIEGCGKSTQVRILHEKFIKSGKSVLVTREPGSGDFGEKIRQLLLRTSSVKLLPMTELFLLVADRSQHVESLIKPSLRAGKIVICDRYTDSSLAYQGFGRGIPLDLINTLNDQATGGVMPDLTIIVDMDTEKSLLRSKLRLRQQDMFEQEGRFEEESLTFHNRVRNGYLKLARQHPERIKVVNGDTTIAELSAAIWEIVINWLKKYENE